MGNLFIGSIIYVLLIASKIKSASAIRLVEMNMTHIHFVDPDGSTINQATTTAATTAKAATLKTTTKLPWPNLSCDFDSGNKCGWENPKNAHDMDDFDWKLGEGKDAHKRKTGAKDDHGGGGGYVYIKSGSTRNRTAKLITNLFKLPKPGCLKFWYHMRGKHMGHLKVYESRDLKGQISFRILSIHSGVELPQYMPVTTINYRPLWGVYGSQGSEWQEAVVPIRKSPYRKVLVFEAFDWDGGRQGNILLDDVTFTQTTQQDACTLSPVAAAPPTRVPPTTATPITTAAPTTAEPPTTVEPPTTAVPTTSRGQTSPTDAVSSRLQTAAVELSTTVGTASRTTKGVQKPTTTTAALDSKVSVGTIITDAPATDKTAKQALPPGQRATPTQSSITAVADRSKMYTAVGVVGIFLILGVALLFFVLYKRRRRFDYYDNCTVAMTRMSPDIVKITDNSMEYRKLM